MNIIEGIPSNTYPALHRAFVAALERTELSREGCQQLIHYPGGAQIKLKTQNERQELSLHRLIVVDGNFERISIVVRQNGPETQPYQERPKMRSWLDRPKRFAKSEFSFYPT